MIHTIYRAALTAAAAAAVITALPAAPVIAQSPAGAYAPCEYEDSTNCVWDARHMGNGSGKSFISTKKGKTIFIPHRAAHALIR